MTRFCFLTSADMMKDRPGAREDWIEFDLEFGALSKACAGEGIELVSEIWDADFDPCGYSGFMIGTVWDYPPKQQTFLSTLDRLAGTAPVFNPPHLVRWNIEKTYLRDLANAGAPSIATLWADAADDKTIKRAFEALNADRIVVKPLVGGGAWRQALIGRGEAIPPAHELPPGACLIQPFLPGVRRRANTASSSSGARSRTRCRSCRKRAIIASSRSSARVKWSMSPATANSTCAARCSRPPPRSLERPTCFTRAWIWCAALMAGWR
ncbi:MAG: hypothetical protein ACOC20_01335 [Oceanicaulis sp.]